MTSECIREGFDEKREGEAFVTEVHAAQGQNRSPLLASKYARVVGRMSLVVDKPWTG